MRSYFKILGASILVTGSAFAQNSFPSTGKVGIGTTDPQRQLVIVSPDSNTTPWANASNTLLLINPMADIFQHESEIIFNNGSSNFSGIAGNYDTYGNQAGGSLRFGTKSGNSSNGANILERMRITSEGNVGIGTTSPAFLLDVNGLIRTPSALVIGDNSSANGMHITNDGSASGLRFWSGAYGAGSLRMQISGSGNVGIGTTSPGFKLDVAGQIRSSSGGIVFPDGSVQATAYTQVTAGSNTITQSNGNVGIGTTSPGYPLQVNGEAFASAGFRVASGAGDDVNGAPWYGIGNVGFLLPGSNTNSGTTVQLAGFGGLNFQTGSGQMVLSIGGNVGIGTTAPGSKLEVNGSVKLTSGSGASITFPDNTVQYTAWNGTTLGGDYAESIDITGDRDEYEPGDVILIDAKSPGKFLKSPDPYSRLVAGVYSTKPGLVGRRTTADRPDKAAEIPMAMMGIVPVKVSTENGAIETGDLLVSASTPGYAMKGTDEKKLRGAVIGKALAPLTAQSGLIEVLVSLQ